MPGISRHEEADLLAQIRDARAQLLRDAEAFHAAAMVLEHIGQLHCGEIRSGLGRYKQEIIDLACQAEPAERQRIERLFAVVKECRNSAVHQGAWARHHSTRLIDLLLMLEEAIASRMTHVEDLMVRTPLVAHLWQRISDVRKAMLANSFSSPPLRLED